MFRKPKKPSADEMMASFLAQTPPTTPTPASEVRSELELKFDALWLLVQERLGLSEEDLSAKVALLKKPKEESIQPDPIDPPMGVQKCPKCERTVSAKSGICIYCGKDDPA